MGGVEGGGASLVQGCVAIVNRKGLRARSWTPSGGDLTASEGRSPGTQTIVAQGGLAR